MIARVPALDIVLHLGAHKTATTYLQTLLDRNAEVLRRHRIGLAHPKRLRPIFKAAPSPRYTTSLGRRIAARAWALEQLIGSARDLGRQRLIISEEQLIGSLRFVLQGRGLYRDIAREVRAASQALDGQPVRVMFAVRSYDSFYISAWGQMLRGSGYQPFTADVRDQLLESRRGWPEVLADLMRALPRGSELTVWRYERLRKSLPRILSRMLGEAAARAIEPFGGNPLPGPTGAAIEAIEALVNARGSTDPDEIRRMFREYGKDQGYAAYDPWTAEEKSGLQRRYRDDIAFIRELWPGALICDAPARNVEALPPEPASRAPMRARTVQSGVSM